MTVKNHVPTFWLCVKWLHTSLCLALHCIWSWMVRMEAAIVNSPRKCPWCTHPTAIVQLAPQLFCLSTADCACFSRTKLYMLYHMHMSLVNESFKKQSLSSSSSFLLQIHLEETPSKRQIHSRLHQKTSSRKPQRWIPSPVQTLSVKVPLYPPRYLLRFKGGFVMYIWLFQEGIRMFSLLPLFLFQRQISVFTIVNTNNSQFILIYIFIQIEGFHKNLGDFWFSCTHCRVYSNIINKQKDQ